MKICFTTSTFKIGEKVGPSLVMMNLYHFFQSKGVEVSFSPAEGCDVLFIFQEAPIELVKRKRKEGAKVIQRLGGAYIDISQGQDIKRLNVELGRISKETDFVIYQSQFAKEICWRYLGPPPKSWKIIYNPVDTVKFSPYGRKINFGRNLLLAVSTWRPWKRLQDSVFAVKELLRYRSDLVFVIIGRGVTTEGSSNRIRYLGELSHQELPVYYRSADIFLFPSWLDPCPNVVLESLASGTPVICTDTGGTPELVGDSGVIINTGEYFNYEPKEAYNFEAIPKVDPERFIQAINLILENKREYSWRARRRARRFSLEVIGNQYLEAIEEVLNVR